MATKNYKVALGYIKTFKIYVDGIAEQFRLVLDMFGWNHNLTVSLNATSYIKQFNIIDYFNMGVMGKAIKNFPITLGFISNNTIIASLTKHFVLPFNNLYVLNITPNLHKKVSSNFETFYEMTIGTIVAKFLSLGEHDPFTLGNRDSMTLGDMDRDVS
jgi:hypothetical protein